MGRLITFDLDKLIATINRVAPGLPELMETAAELGINIPGSLAGYSKLIPVAAGMLGKIAGPSDGGMSVAGIDLGSAGRGRLKYLRGKSQWTDKEVCEAVEIVVLPPEAKGSPGLQAAPQIIACIEYTSRVMYPNISNFSDAQTRAAIDSILESDGLASEIMCDRFGDHLYFCLTHKTRETKNAAI